MSKRILISVTNDISYDQRMQKTARTLAKDGYSVTIFGRLKPLSIAIQSNDFEAVRVSMIFSSGKLFYLEYNIRLLFFLLMNRFDVLCAVDLDSILPNVLIGKIRNCPVIYDAHEYFTEVPELANRPIVKRVWKSIEQYSLPKCAKMYTVGPCIAKLFQNEYGKNCEVICNFPRSIQRIPSQKSKKFTIIYQGDLNEGRGVDVMIKAMVKIPDVLFWVVGDGYERLRLEELVQSLNLGERVTFYGYIAPSEINSLTSKAHLGVNLLENIGLNHYYSLANKFFDYIQNGIPVLTMDFPEYREVNEKYQIAILVKEMDIQEIVTAIESLIQNQDFYSNLAKNTDLASRFLTWESQEEKLCSIYNDVE